MKIYIATASKFSGSPEKAELELKKAKVKLGNLKKANKDKLFANRRPAKRIPTRIPK